MTIQSFIHSERHMGGGVIAIALALSVAATIISFQNDWIVAYGDSESHLNIAKRIMHSITPGFAQLGGIWLPIPHLLLLPFVSIEPLYRTGLAGSIVSGFSYIVSTLFLFKTIRFMTKSNIPAVFGALVFASNPNILYMQTTPMTELPLIMFFTLATYYTIRYIYDTNSVYDVFLAAFFGFCATLSRYDGWFLVMFQALAIFLRLIARKMQWTKLEGITILFCTLAFSGIAAWLMWDFLILGDPLYFTNSQFSAKSQQNSWNARGELPGYHNIQQSVVYYTVTAWSNTGAIVFALSLMGVLTFLAYNRNKAALLITGLFFVPWIFYVVTLYLGQSVIFIPELTPVDFEWNLFNVRYGIMMVPFVGFFCGYFFHKLPSAVRPVLVLLCLFQVGLFLNKNVPVLTLADGIVGLSHAKRPDAEQWIKANYDDGLVLLDDYARTVSVVRSDIPMQNIIYIGNRPYWEESLIEPEKYAKWIIMQKDDTVWRNLIDNQDRQDRLYKYFEKAYTSEEILIFEKKQQSVVLCLEISSCR
ncbi:MAG: glycosyltransferase family 39 protein [bacterium]|nr:glycosyltransferase family 39 protein [bacterium]